MEHEYLAWVLCIKEPAFCYAANHPDCPPNWYLGHRAIAFTMLLAVLEALVLPCMLSLSVVSLTFGSTGVLQGTSMCRAADSLETRANRA